MSPHLRPEQFNDLLLGAADGHSNAHLGNCPQCRAQMAAMREALGSFRTAALGWSEGAAKHVAFPKTAKALPLWPKPVWVWASAALVIALAISFSVSHRRGARPLVTADPQAQISRDNQLLAHIESEVEEITPTPMQPLQTDPQAVRTR